MSKIKHTVLALVCALFLGSTASSQNLFGPLSGTLGPGTYYVVGTIFVDPDDSLNIEPGTDFLFSGEYNFIIYGKLTAIGTESDSIRFMQNPGFLAWGGLDFYNPTTDSSRFEYCVFQGSYSIGLYLENCGPTFSHCSIRDNDSGG